MNKEDIAAAITKVEHDLKRRRRRSKYPTTLGLNGLICESDFFDTSRWRSQLSRGLLVDARKKLVENQELLLNSGPQCSAICALLANVKHTKSVDRETLISHWCFWAGDLRENDSVYGSWHGPSYGQLLAAAVHCGVKLAPRDDTDYSFQAWLGLSARCMAQLRWLHHMNPSLFHRLVRDSISSDPKVRDDARFSLASRRAFNAKGAQVRAALEAEYRAVREVVH